MKPRRPLAGQRGSVDIVLALLVALPLLLFFTFAGPLYHIQGVRRDMMQDVLDRYLQEAQLQGGFTAEMWARMQDDLLQRKFTLANLRFTGSTTVGEYKHRGEPIVLWIGYPRGDELDIMGLIGGQPPNPAEYVWVYGSILSERP